MKKAILILFSTFLFTGTLFSQMTLVSYDGFGGGNTEEIFDGDILMYNQVGDVIYFSIENSSSDPINVKIKVEEITNTDGSEVQFCIGGNCLVQIDEGTIYPISGNPIEVAAGGNTMQQFDHFQNDNAGDGSNYPMDYVFKFFQVDEDDNEIGNPITFTYRFDPNLSVSGFENNLGVTLQNTLAIDLLTVRSMKSLNFEILNINGQLMDFSRIDSGINNLNVSNFNPGVYFIRFADENGNTTTMKFVIK
jgi:hypothetical protein